MALRQRLLQDLAELQSKPYPGIQLTSYDNDITKACLVLTVGPSQQKLHLRINFSDQYPLVPPSISIQTHIDHPNILGSYVCASILNTDEGYTPAYTLKGICIQILSFFTSDSLEQDYGWVEDLGQFRKLDGSYFTYGSDKDCVVCGYKCVPTGLPREFPGRQNAVVSGMLLSNSTSPSKRRRRGKKPSEIVQDGATGGPSNASSLPVAEIDTNVEETTVSVSTMPDEILINICNYLEVEELAPFAQAWSRIGGAQGIITRYNIIRNRELVCFCLKKGFEASKLGVGVRVTFNGRLGTLESEFDFLSYQAYSEFKVRKSVQGLSFDYWVPLALSRKHYHAVKDHVQPSLAEIGVKARLTPSNAHNVIISFMNDIVVKLSQEAARITKSDRQSSLGRASEKAIESYYQLFHLLLCLASENPQISRWFTRQVEGVLQGKISKHDIPNLGHLLIIILIADVDMTDQLLMAIIKETVTRNVVWMLDDRGAGLPELSYLEADAVSVYRLEKTFNASLTSYRLLMFLNLFRQTINRGGSSKKTLVQLRDELFDAHGAPPKGTAARLAGEIVNLQQVDSFPKFLVRMGLKPPPASDFTAFLRRCVVDSMKKGYSVWRYTQADALRLREMTDPAVQTRDKSDLDEDWNRVTGTGSFFPNSGGRKNGGGYSRGRGR